MIDGASSNGTLTAATGRMSQAETKLHDAARNAQAQPGGPPGGNAVGRPSANPDEKVVDAAFEEVGDRHA